MIEIRMRDRFANLNIASIWTDDSHTTTAVQELVEGRSETDRSKFCIILRELLSQASENGNATGVNPRIVCEIEALDDSLVRITVEDQANGYDYQALPHELQERKKRSFALVTALCDDIDFDAEENRVTALLRWSPTKTSANALQAGA